MLQVVSIDLNLNLIWIIALRVLTEYVLATGRGSFISICRGQVIRILKSKVYI